MGRFDVNHRTKWNEAGYGKQPVKWGIAFTGATSIGQLRFLWGLFSFGLSTCAVPIGTRSHMPRANKKREKYHWYFFSSSSRDYIFGSASCLVGGQGPSVRACGFCNVWTVPADVFILGLGPPVFCAGVVTLSLTGALRRVITWGQQLFRRSCLVFCPSDGVTCLLLRFPLLICDVRGPFRELRTCRLLVW